MDEVDRVDDEFTRLLRASRGDAVGDQRLLALVYAELRRIASGLIARERAGHTLSPTALVHEAWLRLAGGAPAQAADRRQFLAIAAHRMRQVLVDHARRRDADKRGGAEAERITLSALADAGAAEGADEGVDVLALEAAMAELEAADPRKARVVELRYFAGLEMGEIAEVLGVSRATAHRDWDVARAFLFKALR